MKLIKEFEEFIMNVGCKRIITLTVVGTWAASQLLRVGAVIADKPHLASQVGVSQEFSYLAFLIAGSYFGFSATKFGMQLQQKIDTGK